MGAAHPAAAAAIRAVAAAVVPPSTAATVAPVSSGIGGMQSAQQMAALGVVNPVAVSAPVSSVQDATETANAARFLEMAAHFQT